MEQETIWPDDYDELEPDEKLRLEEALHADPEAAAHLVYLRTHTGFCRQITVTPNDVERLGS